MNRSVLAEQNVHPAVSEKIAGYQQNLLTEVKDAVEQNDVVVVGMAQNPHVKKARSMLEDRDVSFAYLEYGSYLSAWRRRLAIKMWTGWPTFPMVFVKGTFVGGCEDVSRLATSGELDALLSAPPS